MTAPLSGSLAFGWFGRYEFGSKDPFFADVVAVARRYADREPDRRPTEEQFQNELARLSAVTPVEARALVDQIEHRWRYPSCPSALYAITFTLAAPPGGALIADDGSLVQTLACTKVGKAKRTVAARIERYTWDVVGGIRLEPRSQTLRILAYGRNPTMVSERELQRHARQVGTRAMVADASGERRLVGSETFVGQKLVDELAAFLRERVA